MKKSNLGAIWRTNQRALPDYFGHVIDIHVINKGKKVYFKEKLQKNSIFTGMHVLLTERHNSG